MFCILSMANIMHCGCALLAQDEQGNLTGHPARLKGPN